VERGDGSRSGKRWATHAGGGERVERAYIVHDRWRAGFRINALPWHSKRSDQAVLPLSPGIVFADQVPCHVHCRSKIIVRSGRREFPQKMLGVVPGYPSHLEAWKNMVWKLWIRNNIPSQAHRSRANQERYAYAYVGLSSMLTIERNYYIIRKGVAVWSISPGKPRESRLIVKLAWTPTCAKHRQPWWYAPHNGRMARSLRKDGIQYVFILKFSTRLHQDNPYSCLAAL